VKSSSKVPFFSFSVVVVVVVTRLKSFNNNQAIPASQPAPAPVAVFAALIYDCLFFFSSFHNGVAD
jgi:hypothetical protein